MDVGNNNALRMRKLPTGDYVLEKNESSLSLLREFSESSERRKILEDAVGSVKVLDFSTYYPFKLTQEQVKGIKATGLVEFV